LEHGRAVNERFNLENAKRQAELLIGSHGRMLASSKSAYVHDPSNRHHVILFNASVWVEWAAIWCGDVDLSTTDEQHLHELSISLDRRLYLVREHDETSFGRDENPPFHGALVVFANGRVQHPRTIRRWPAGELVWSALGVSAMKPGDGVMWHKPQIFVSRQLIGFVDFEGDRLESHIAFIDETRRRPVPVACEHLRTIDAYVYDERNDEHWTIRFCDDCTEILDGRSPDMTKDGRPRWG
jgi:hypothetical protein